VGKKDNYPEASSTGMIVYALQKGVDLKILDKSYSGVAQKGWQALQANITTYKDGGPQINSVAPGMGRCRAKRLAGTTSKYNHL